MENANKSSSHAVFNIKLHIVFVTKYRRKTFTPELLEYLETTFAEVLAAWRCKLLEFGGEPDHVHLLIDIHPALDISVLINNLKTASARRTRNRFAVHLGKFYSKPLFWHRAYFIGSVGGTTRETVRAYVDAQGTEEHARKAKVRSKNGSSAQFMGGRGVYLRWLRKICLPFLTQRLILALPSGVGMRWLQVLHRSSSTR